MAQRMGTGPVSTGRGAGAGGGKDEAHREAEVDGEALDRELEEMDALEDFALSGSEDEGAGGRPHGKLDAAMMNELLLVCSNLGMLRVPYEGAEPVLMRGEDCEQWIYDLQRAIRRDHAKHKLVAQQLGRWRILQKKLLPLLVNHQHDWTLVFSILKVLVMLTMKPPRDSTNIAQQLKYLREYKRAFLQEGVIAILMTILVDPLSKTGSARTAHDYLNMELVLTLLRNLLSIPNEDMRAVTAGTSHLSRLQEDLICTLHQENVYEMVLLFAQDIESPENREWNLLIMEMMDLTLSCAHPKLLAAFTKRQLAQQQPAAVLRESTAGPTAATAAATSESLTSQLSREKKRSRQPTEALGSRRHSNFGGMMKLVGATGRATVLTSLDKMGDQQVPQAKKKPMARARGGGRRGVAAAASATAGMDIREFFAPRQTVSEGDIATLSVLEKICTTILSKSFFQLTNSLKGEFRRGSSKLVSTDRLQYFHLVWFLTTYHRLAIQARKSIYRHKCKATPSTSDPPPRPEYNEKAILSSLDMFSFNFVLQSIETYASSKNHHAMTVSVQLLTEMMTYLSELGASDDTRMQRIADSLQHKIFYERDFLDRLPVLLKTWTPAQFTLDYVIDVVTLTHIVFKVLDAQGTIKVLSRRKAHLAEKQIKAKKKAEGGGDGDSNDDDDSDDEESAERRAQLLLEMQRKEADFDVRRYFQSILSYDTIKMYCYLLSHYRTNNAKVNHYVHSFFYRAKHFRIHMDHPSWTMQPLLFSMPALLVFDRMLQDPHIQRQHEFQGFLEFIRGVVRDFFALAESNNVLFVETLLRQPYASKACLLMQRNYEPMDSMTRSRHEAVALGRDEELARISAARRQRREIDAEDLDGEAEFEFTLDTADFQSSSLVAANKNAGDEVPDESGVAPGRRRSRAATARAKTWSPVEDRFLKKVYQQYRHLPSVYEVISYEDMFQDRDRTPEQIERRVKYLKLHRRTHDSSDEDDKNGSDNEGDGDIGSDGNDRVRLPKGLEMDGDSDPEAGLHRATTRLRRRLRRGALSSDEDDEDDDDVLAQRMGKDNDASDSDADLFDALPGKSQTGVGMESADVRMHEGEKTTDNSASPRASTVLVSNTLLETRMAEELTPDPSENQQPDSMTKSHSELQAPVPFESPCTDTLPEQVPTAHTDSNAVSVAESVLHADQMDASMFQVENTTAEPTTDSGIPVEDRKRPRVEEGVARNELSNVDDTSAGRDDSASPVKKRKQAKPPTPDLVAESSVEAPN